MKYRYQPTLINFENVFYLTFGPLAIIAAAVICWVVG